MKLRICVVPILLFITLAPVILYSQTSADYDSLDAYILKAMSDFEQTGLAIAVVKDSTVVFCKGYGFKHLENEAPMTTSALFNIASCSKAFTAACLGKLVDEGKLTWNAKVTDYIQGFRLEDPYITQQLNIKDIRSHRSGLATFYGDLLWYETQYSNAEIIHRMRHLPILNDFRLQFGYQNNMFMIAGEIVREITGKSWDEYLYDQLFKPLNMVQSRACSKHLKPDQDIAYPHLKRKVQEITAYGPNPAGSIYSSVDEMAHWILMLLNDGIYNGRQVLSPRTIQTLFAPQTILPVGKFMKEAGIHFHNYGLGWMMFDYSGHKVVEHDGGMPGYLSKVTLVPEENLGFVILTNDMTALYSAMGLKLLDFFLKDSDRDWAAEYLRFQKQRETYLDNKKAERESKRVKRSKPSRMLESYVGLYRDTMYGDARILLKDKKLHLTLIPAAEKFYSTMEHWHFDTFRIKFADEFLPEGYVNFKLNTDAEIVGFTIDLPNPDFHFFNLDFKKVE